MRGPLVALSLAAALLVAAPSAAQNGARPSGQLVPRAGALLGAWVDSSYGDWAGWGTRREAEITELETEIGRRFDIDHHFYGWSTPFPGRLERWDIAEGRIPLVSWGGERDFPGLDSILAGRWDGLVRERARELAALGHPVFLRWGWEMNTRWPKWGGWVNNEGDRQTGPQKFVAAWRRLHDLFLEEGATNVAWVWAPNADSIPSEPWNSWSRYYPGDDYVDWVGIDGYNWGGPAWRSASSIFGPVYRAYAGRKPVMVAETGSVEEGGSKPVWIASAAAALKRTFPRIAAFVYFSSSKDRDWRITSSPAALRAFRAMAHDPYFQPRRGFSPALAEEQPPPRSSPSGV